MVQSYMHFRNFVIISLWKGAWPSFESLPKMHLDYNCEKLPTDGWPLKSEQSQLILSFSLFKDTHKKPHHVFKHVNKIISN